MFVDLERYGASISFVSINSLTKLLSSANINNDADATDTTPAQPARHQSKIAHMDRIQISGLSSFTNARSTFAHACFSKGKTDLILEGVLRVETILHEMSSMVSQSIAVDSILSSTLYPYSSGHIGLFATLPGQPNDFTPD